MVRSHYYFQIKKHVWVTVLGIIIVLYLYDQILRSTLVIREVVETNIQHQTPTALLKQHNNHAFIPKPKPNQPQPQSQPQSEQILQPAADGNHDLHRDKNDSAAAGGDIIDPITPPYHVVFSTSCSLQQDWESYVFFYHCRRVRQPGNITRIVSGCNDVETKKLKEFHDKYIATIADVTIQQFLIHFTPSYGSLYLSEGKYPYKYMNKPYGLRHWMENYLHLGWTGDNTTITSSYSINNQPQQHQDVLDGVVILMDPDMVLFQPITHDFSDETILWADNKEPATKKVVHGNPISQQDGYLSNEWMYFNFSFITGDPTIKPPPSSDGPIHWNTGPPYLATVLDMYRIVSVWTETAPRVLTVYPQLFAEMYGFVIATVMLQLPFQMTKSIVISTTSASDREGWPFIDTLPDEEICHIPVRATTVNSSSWNKNPKLPIGLHYCGIYLLGKSMFSKYRIKKNILDCNKGLMKLPPSNVYPQYNYKIYPRRADSSDAETYKEVQQVVTKKLAKREAFMICGMVSALNEALRFYKQQACGVEGLPMANYNETYTIHDDPTDF